MGLRLRARGLNPLVKLEATQWFDLGVAQKLSCYLEKRTKNQHPKPQSLTSWPLEALAEGLAEVLEDVMSSHGAVLTVSGVYAQLTC